jgi:hypothetical protein
VEWLKVRALRSIPSTAKKKKKSPGWLNFLASPVSHGAIYWNEDHQERNRFRGEIKIS